MHSGHTQDALVLAYDTMAKENWNMPGKTACPCKVIEGQCAWKPTIPRKRRRIAPPGLTSM